MYGSRAQGPPPVLVWSLSWGLSADHWTTIAKGTELFLSRLQSRETQLLLITSTWNVATQWPAVDGGEITGWVHYSVINTTLNAAQMNEYFD